MKLDHDNTVVLCSRKGRGCCPKITRVEKGFVITDDYDGKVFLTKEEAQLLRDTLNTFSSNDEE